MNITTTISTRASLGLQEAAMRNQSTPEELASELVEQQGVLYANIYKIGILTSSAFVLKFNSDEYAAILSAAEQNAQVDALVHDLMEVSSVVLDSPRLISGLELLVDEGLLTSERMTELLTFGLPEQSPTVTTVDQELTISDNPETPPFETPE